jgi:hypothetical protein
MVPIHESDVAENRWKDDEWRQFELWEKLEQKARRKRSWTIIAAAVVFVSILSVPIFQDRIPKWRALGATRGLAVRANQMKVDAASLKLPLRLRLENSDSGPRFVIEKVASCASDSAAPGEIWGQGVVFRDAHLGSRYAVLSAAQAGELGLERVKEAVCYDPAGLDLSSDGVKAVGILPVKDLAEGRLDRASFLNFSGLFAEIGFD